MPRMQLNEKYYTLSQAMKVLGMTEGMLYNHVKAGHLQRIIPPNRKQGIYLKDEVDKLAIELQAFFAVKQTPEVLSSTFRLATPNDLPECGELIHSIYHVSSNLARRGEWLEKNPETGFVLRDEQDRLVGCAFVLPLLPTKIEEILATEVTPPIWADDIQRFEVGRPTHLYIRTVGVSPGISRIAKRAYGLRLIAGLMEFVLDLGRRGVEIKEISARSETTDGIHLLKNLNFPEVPSTTTNRNFRLNIEHADHPLVTEYKQLLKEAQDQMQGEQK
jgi:hypothetical protein